MAAEAGVWGIVCAPGDLKHVSHLRDRIKFVTPNIRLSKEGPVDDQNRDRQMAPEEAIEAGADLLVIGRPVTKADDPVATLATINDRIESVLSRLVSG
jgi:orotidine-5'-phosphate decarboxylase